ncbi:MAG: hypothetical protein U0792_05100 [Gemmataceae bacterium]
MRCVAWVLVAVVVTGTVRPAAAQPGPLAPPPPSAPAGSPPVLGTNPYDPNLPPEPPADPPMGQATPASAPVDRPPNVLGAPVLGAPVGPADRELPPTPVAASLPTENSPIVAAAAASTAASETRGPGRRAKLGAPISAGSPISAESVEISRTSYNSPDAPTADPVNELLTQRARPVGRKQNPNADANPDGPQADDRSSNKFGDKISDAMGNALGSCKEWFKSDHAFDGFISPVTNPFLFEDPRSLTEVRPIFMYQKIPSGQPDFNGGNIWYYGAQARLAVTDRLSFTFNKLGGISLYPGSGSTYQDATGFAELWLGPKYTFLRSEETGSLMAGGLQFQIPIGSASVYQNTGSLSLVPYLTYGQNFGRDLKIGSFNALVGTGYSFSTTQARSDYYYLSGHLDLDVMNKHRFYPLVEMNWLYYTTNGNTMPIGTEGRDLFNLGAQAKSTGMLTTAIGARFKISEAAQIGTAFEFPLAGPKDMFQYRITLDFILRY